jgi:hypothetical protein
MSIIPFRPKSPPRDSAREVIIAAMEVISRFIEEGGDEDGNCDLEAFVRALREEMYRERFQLRFDFDSDHAS